MDVLKMECAAGAGRCPTCSSSALVWGQGWVKDPMGCRHPFRRLCLSFPRGGLVLSVVLQQPQRSPCSTIHPLCTLMSGPHSQDTANPLARTCIPLAFLPFPSATWQQAAGPSLPMGGHFRVCLGQMGGLSILQMCQGLEDRTSSGHFHGCPRVQGDGGEVSGGVHSASHAPAVSVTAFVICHTGCSLLPQEKKKKNQGTES